MARHTSTKPKKKRAFRLGRLIVWMFAAAAFAVFCALGAYLYFIINGERLLAANAGKLRMDEASIIYDADGNEVTRLFKYNREIASYSDFPDDLINAFVAVEDRRFEEHVGIDPWAIGRALYKDIIHRSKVEGGSTITQQLAKRMFLSSEKTWFRKATEASIAIALENKFTKNEIMEMYLNEIYFGKGTYGVKTAAERYFGVTDLSQLELWQSATLAAIPKSPGTYSPMLNPEKSMERRAVVLRLMYNEHYITEEQRKEAAQVEYVAPEEEQDAQEFRSYVDFLLKEAVSTAGISEEDLLRGGYKVYTAINVNAQRIMEEAFANEELFPKDGPEQKSQGGMVIVDQHTGGIVAMVGGRDYVAKGWNRALVPRQPGSSFKPIAVYGPALESGWTPYSKVSDEKRKFGDYSPSNIGGNYHGSVPMIEAVKHSYNLAAVWTLNEIGVKKGMQFSESLGIPLSSEDRNLSIALGGLTDGATPLQMAQAYAAFADGGVQRGTHSIVRITDANDREVYALEPTEKIVMSEKTAYYMTQMLQTVVEPGGTGRRAAMKRPVAGKTGTTQSGIKGVKGNRDIWFVGYTPEWTAAVWMGFDKTDANHSVKDSSGLAAQMFQVVMSKALEGRKIVPFDKPKDVPDLMQPPEAPTGLSADYNGDHHEIRLSWTAAGDGIGYRVFRKEAEEPDYALLLETALTDVRDISIQYDKTYSFYVIAYRTQTGVESAASPPISVVVPPEDRPDDLIPELPEDLIPDIPHPGEETPGSPGDGGEDEQEGQTDDSEGYVPAIPEVLDPIEIPGFESAR